MPKDYDVIVIGVGAMGSAALYHLASRGQRVLGLERFDIPHDRGSSHGVTRIIRLGYYEHPSYVPLVQRAYELWRELQERMGYRLLHITGSIEAGKPGSAIFEGSKRACEQHSLAHEILEAGELNRRFPGYRLPPDMMAVFQPAGGFLLPEICISAHVMMSQQHDAEVHAREQVLGWEASSNGVRVRTDRGTYEAERLVVAAGAWISKLVSDLAGVAVPERQILAWLQPYQPQLFTPDRFPVFNLLVDEGHFYGFPAFGVPGFKFGRYHHRQEIVDPDHLDRECHPEDEDMLRQFAERYFPDGAGSTMAMRSCMFTNTADEHFIVDRHPEFPQVILASPCSGHGFKFSSVIGEILADLAERGDTRHDISLFRLARLSQR